MFTKMTTKVRLCFTVLCSMSLFFVYAEEEIYLPFRSSALTVKCGESTRQQNITLELEEGINVEYAVQLNWTIDTLNGVRFKAFTREVTCPRLNYGDHNGLGNGKNRRGFRVLIKRTLNTETNTYTYREDFDLYQDDVPCETPHPNPDGE